MLRPAEFEVGRPGGAPGGTARPYLGRNHSIVPRTTGGGGATRQTPLETPEEQQQWSVSPLPELNPHRIGAAMVYQSSVRRRCQRRPVSPSLLVTGRREAPG